MAVAQALATNGSLKTLDLAMCMISNRGARALARALCTNSQARPGKQRDRHRRCKVALDGAQNQRHAQGAQAGAAQLFRAAGAWAIFREAFQTNHTLQDLGLGQVSVPEGTLADRPEGTLADRLRVNEIEANVHTWVLAAVARRIELPRGLTFPQVLLPNLQIPASMNAQIAFLASGEELVPATGWCAADGRRLASARILQVATSAYIAELDRMDVEAARESSLRAHSPLPHSGRTTQ